MPPGDVDFAFPGEIALIRCPSDASVPPSVRRHDEHVRGRTAARAALAALGGAELAQAPLAADPDGLPMWPSGVVGSISHSDPWAAAAVSSVAAGVSPVTGGVRCVRGIGVDVERVVASRAELWERVVMPEDAASAPEDASRAFLATLCFSLRESVYKCVYPVMRKPMDWRDARFAIDWTSGAVAVRLHPRFAFEGTLAAQFRELDGAVITACWWTMPSVTP